MIPLRLLASQSRMKMDESADPWAPICFDLDGLRIALSFDLNRDIELLPPGTDACLYFQLSPFSVDELSATLGAGSCISQYRNLAEQHRIWIVCMAPVGLYDSDLYVGGSFVLDDSANIIASAALFEQDLLVCDFGKISGEKPSTSNALESISSSELLWGALRRSVTDFVESFDAQRFSLNLMDRYRVLWWRRLPPMRWVLGVSLPLPFRPTVKLTGQGDARGGYSLYQCSC